MTPTPEHVREAEAQKELHFALHALKLAAHHREPTLPAWDEVWCKVDAYALAVEQRVRSEVAGERDATALLSGLRVKETFVVPRGEIWMHPSAMYIVDAARALVQRDGKGGG